MPARASMCIWASTTPYSIVRCAALSDIEPRLGEATPPLSYRESPARDISPTGLCEILEPCCRLLLLTHRQIGPVAKIRTILPCLARCNGKRHGCCISPLTPFANGSTAAHAASSLAAISSLGLLINLLLPCTWMCTNGAPSSIPELIACFCITA